MEHLKAELSTVLGEKLSRLERISEQPYAHLYALYDNNGNAMPLLAKSYVCQGIAQQEAYKLSMLAREGDVRLPTVYGVVITQEAPYKELLLIERLRGVSVEAPTRTPERWSSLMDHVVESVLLWHRIDSHGCVGSVDSTQDNDWLSWYQQRLEVLWSTLLNVGAPLLTQEDRSMLKDPCSDQLLAIINPGMMLWAPREYDMFRLCEPGMSEALLYRYLQKAPLAENFVYRRWLYVI